MTTPILIIPGLGNSGPSHWQSLWQDSSPLFKRVEQADWENPQRADWVAALDLQISAATEGCILVAHSLGCLTVAHWAADYLGPVKAALLVAPPDASAASFPTQISGFETTPFELLPFPSILVASDNDPYAEASFSQQCATAWGSRFMNIGSAGHINASSGLGAWPAGIELLNELSRL